MPGVPATDAVGGGVPLIRWYTVRDWAVFCGVSGVFSDEEGRVKAAVGGRAVVVTLSVVPRVI